MLLLMLMRYCVAMQLAGYKVKCMLAEPKGKRTHMDTTWSDPASPLSQQELPALCLLHQPIASFDTHLHAFNWAACIQQAAAVRCSERGLAAAVAMTNICY